MRKLPGYNDPPAKHVVPCQGIPEIQRVQTVLEGRITVLESRMDGFDAWQKRQNGTLQEMHQDLQDSRKERFAQVEGVSAQVRQLLIMAITIGVPAFLGVLYIILNHVLVK